MQNITIYTYHNTVHFSVMLYLNSLHAKNFLLVSAKNYEKSAKVARTILFSVLIYFSQMLFNTLSPRQNGRHFADDIFKLIFLNENVWIPIKNSLKFVPHGPIHNIPALVQIMAWRRPGDKSLSGPMMVKLPTHKCVTRPRWVKTKCCLRLVLWSAFKANWLNSHKLLTRIDISIPFARFCK